MDVLVKEVVFYSIINSFVTFGVIQTILKIVDKDSIHRFYGLGITYGLGLIMGFMITNGDPIWQKIVWGVSIGAVSVALYKSAVQSLLNVIPAIVGRIFGGQIQIKNSEENGEGN